MPLRRMKLRRAAFEPEAETYKRGTAWRKAGHDSLSIIADPRITEGRKTWRVAKNSPALKLGFKPYDWSVCGPRPKSERG